MMPSILRQAWVPDNIRGMYVTVCVLLFLHMRLQKSHGSKS